MANTVAAAIEARKSQGSLETEVSCGGEADLPELEKSCTKNPEHKKFIFVDEMTTTHLPAGYQDVDILECVFGLYAITVRVKLSYTSNGRPDFYQGTNVPYPFSDLKGSAMMRTGSGWLRKVTNSDLKNGEICGCKKCRDSSVTHKERTEIVIRTAAHVVCDIQEGVHTTCHFFFDRGESPDDCEGAIELSEAVRVVSDVKDDWCDMTFVTHDTELSLRLGNLLSQYFSLHQKVWEKYPPESKIKLDQDVESALNLAVIASHPHGRRKQISAGYFLDRNIVQSDGSFTAYTYTAATCPGCSGAPVFILGPSRRWWWCSHPHRGGLREVNYSGVGINEEHCQVMGNVDK